MQHAVRAVERDACSRQDVATALQLPTPATCTRGALSACSFSRSRSGSMRATGPEQPAAASRCPRAAAPSCLAHTHTQHTCTARHRPGTRLPSTITRRRHRERGRGPLQGGGHQAEAGQGPARAAGAQARGERGRRRAWEARRPREGQRACGVYVHAHARGHACLRGAPAPTAGTRRASPPGVAPGHPHLTPAAALPCVCSHAGQGPGGQGQVHRAGGGGHGERGVSARMTGGRRSGDGMRGGACAVLGLPGRGDMPLATGLCALLCSS